MKLNEVALYENRSHRILKEGWHDLTEAQQKYQLRWERELFPLLEQYVKLAEAELTADQIQAIFKSAEANAMASGTNKNALGKAGAAAGKAGAAAASAVKLTADVAKQINAKIDELGRAAKEAGPVKDMDTKFKQLKADITAKNGDSKIVQGIQKVSDWAKENPTKASIAVGILTTVAAFAAGPMGGAAAGLIFRSTNELLQGADLSTAIGKSVKTAAYGAIAGWALQGIGDWLEGLRFDAVPYEKAPGLTTLEVGFTETFTAPGVTMKETIGSMIVPEDQVDRFTDLLNTMKDATAATGTTTDPAALNAFGKLKDFADSFDIQEFIKDMNLTNEVAQEIAAQNDAFLQNLTVINQGIAAVAQGSIQGKLDANDVKVGGEPVQGELDLQGGSGTKNTESLDLNSEFDRYLAEAGFKDMIKGAGSAIKTGAKAVGGAAAAVGKELGNKATYQKMMSAWKKAGEPTDTGSIINILQGMGMTPDQISQVGQEQGVELKAKNVGDPDEPAAQPAATTATDAPADDSANAQGDAANADDSAPSQIKPGDTKEINGKTYSWEGALWTDVATGRPLGVQSAADMGLPNPKIDPVVAAIKKAGPEVIKLVIDQVNAKGVKAGTKDAQVAKQAGAKGTQELPAAQNKPKAGIAKPGTVAAKPKATA